MEAEEIAKDLMDTLKAVSDTQSTQTHVINKLSDGLLRTTYIISEMKDEIRLLKKRIEILEKGAE